MKAIVHDEYGDPAEVLRLDQRERPTIGAKQVLVEVRAAGVDQGAWHLIAGMPRVVRLATGPRRPRAGRAGRDLAGVIVAVGAEVADLSIGDEVFGTAEGAWAEYAAADASRIAVKPKGLSFEEAAALPISAGTALQALDAAGVKGRSRVLVLGAAGGVGHFAVQLAKGLGAHVTGVARPAKTDFVRGLGADEVIDYRSQEVTGTFDAILDTGGHRPVQELRRLLDRDGTLVIIGSETDGRMLGGLERAMGASLLSPFVPQKLVMLVTTERREVLDRVAEAVVEGRLRPRIDSVLPLERAGEALRRLRAGEVRGKLVLRII